MIISGTATWYRLANLLVASSRRHQQEGNLRSRTSPSAHRLLLMDLTPARYAYFAVLKSPIGRLAAFPFQLPGPPSDVRVLYT